MMTKKHFKAFADLLESERLLAFTRLTAEGKGGLPAMNAVEHVAQRMASLLARENPRFDRDKFLTACGLTDGNVTN